jgi:hypothetical protein
MTMGIGKYCNHYFLKMVANLGHGFCEIAHTPVRAIASIFNSGVCGTRDF